MTTHASAMNNTNRVWKRLPPWLLLLLMSFNLHCVAHTAAVTTLPTSSNLPTLASANALNSSAPNHSLVISYGSHNGPPFAITHHNVLVGGIIFDIGIALANQLGADVRYQQVPRKRMTRSIQNGDVDMRMIANPQWIKQAEKFIWSAPLFSDRNVVLMRKNDDPPLSVQSLLDLSGKSIGTIYGYYYPKLSPLIQSQRILREDAKTLEANLQKLSTYRIDALIDSELLIRYQLQELELEKHFVFSEWKGESHSIQAMISPISKIAPERIKASFAELKQSGIIDSILSQYIPQQLNSQPLLIPPQTTSPLD